MSKRFKADKARMARTIVTRFGIYFLIALGVLLSASAAHANDIYVAQNSTGAGNGADCANAKALSAVTWAAGNNYHLCGTVTSQVSPGTSGTSGNPITIIFETGAQISMGSCGSTGCINLGGKSYIIVDGSPTSTPCGYVNGADVTCNGTIQATNEGSGLGSTQSIGIYGQSGMNNCEIRNLNINNMYIHSSASDGSGGGNYAIYMHGSNNLIHNNSIHDASAGVKIEITSSNNRYYNNHIYNINWGIFESGSGSSNSITNELIYGNDVHDFANWDTTDDSFHHDGIFLSGNTSTADLTHVDVYNNYLHGTTSNATTCASAYGSCMTAYIYINTDSYVRVFSNLIVLNSGDTGPNNGPVLLFVDDHDSFINNTVIGGTLSGGNTCIHLNSGTNFTVENNIFSNCSSVLWNDGSTFLSLNYNVYQASTLSWRKGSSYYSTLATWQSASGGDAASQATTGSLSIGGSYVPNSGSIAIGAGANLTSLGGTALDSDKAGNARPSSGAWDAGAYQSGTSAQQPTSPTGLSAIAQ
jgi:hypothetical protein